MGAETLDESTFDEHIGKYLKEAYSNVKSFKATNCEIDGDKLIVEGVIGFNSGKEKPTKFEFSENGKGLLEGCNRGIAGNRRAFRLDCSIKDGSLITEGLSWRYRIDKALVKGKTNG